MCTYSKFYTYHKNYFTIKENKMSNIVWAGVRSRFLLWFMLVQL